MALKSELTASGLAAEVARMLGQDASASITPAGTTQADATLTTSSFFATATAGANAGVLLPSATGVGQYAMYNGSGNTIKVYPAVGEYMNGTQNAAFSVSSAKSCVFTPSGNRWIATMSA